MLVAQNQVKKVVLDFDLEERKEVLGKSLKLEYFSPSFISSWNSCPAKALFSSIIREREKIAALDIGTAVHNLFEQKFKGEKPDLKAASNSLGDDKLFKRAKEYYDSYYKIENLDKGANAEGVKHYTEQTITTEVKPLGVNIGIPLKGVIDRLDIAPRSVSIVDYKTASKVPDKNRYVEQVCVYKWLIEAEYGIPVDFCQVIVLNKKNPKVFDYDVDLVVQSKLIDKIVRTKKEVATALDSGVYEKRTSYSCDWCPYSDACGNVHDIEIEEKKQHAGNN